MTSIENVSFLVRSTQWQGIFLYIHRSVHPRFSIPHTHSMLETDDSLLFFLDAVVGIQTDTHTRMKQRERRESTTKDAPHPLLIHSPPFRRRRHLEPGLRRIATRLLAFMSFKVYGYFDWIQRRKESVSSRGISRRQRRWRRRRRWREWWLFFQVTADLLFDLRLEKKGGGGNATGRIKATSKSQSRSLSSTPFPQSALSDNKMELGNGR